VNSLKSFKEVPETKEVFASKNTGWTAATEEKIAD
jgi:hypothetical protein